METQSQVVITRITDYLLSYNMYALICLFVTTFICKVLSHKEKTRANYIIQSMGITAISYLMIIKYFYFVIYAMNIDSKIYDLIYLDDKFLNFFKVLVIFDIIMLYQFSTTIRTLIFDNKPVETTFYIQSTFLFTLLCFLVGFLPILSGTLINVALFFGYYFVIVGIIGIILIIIVILLHY
jgi:hypothetical protein